MPLEMAICPGETHPRENSPLMGWIWGPKQGPRPIPEYNQYEDALAFPAPTPSPIIFYTYFFILNTFVIIYIKAFHENCSKTCFCNVGNMAWIIFGLL